MSFNIGKIAAVVSASDQSFTSTMRRVEKATLQTYSRVDSIAKRMTGSIGNMLSSLAVGATVYQGVERLGAALERIDNAGDAADALNVRSEFLMGLQYDARFAGIEIDKLLVKMRQTIAEAASGSKQDRGVLEALGLNPDQLAGAGTERQLLAIADALREVSDQGERLRISGAIFGGKGVERAAMANYLARGSGAIESGVSQAESMGVAVGAGGVAAASAASDAIDNAKLAVQGLENMVAIRLAPIVEASADIFAENVTSTNRNTTSTDALTRAALDVLVPVVNGADAIKRGTGILADLAGISSSILKFLTTDGIFSIVEGNFAPLEKSFTEFKDSAMSLYDRFANGQGELAGTRLRADVEQIIANAAAQQGAFTAPFGPPVELSNRLDLQELDRRIKLVKELERAEKTLADQRVFALRASEEQARMEALNFASGIAENVMAQQDRLVQEAEDRARRIAEIERQSPGGTRFFEAGSNDARVAQFNASFQQGQQSVQQRQLTTMEMINKAMQEQKDRTRRIEQLMDQVVTQMTLSLAL